MLATSSFESKLYKATSNSTANQPTTAELYTIADHSYVYDDLITILARVKHRLQSDQKAKWKRIRKTLQLIEFLMKNGSIEFVAVMAEKFKCYVEPYVFYEFNKDYEDYGYSIRECARRIIELCKDKEKLKKERADAKKLRTKIVGVGNTMDSFGDKFLSAPDDSKRDSRGREKHRDRDREREKEDANLAIEAQPSGYNSMGSYDPYSSNKPLSEKIGVILGDVDKIKEGDNSEQIKQKLGQNPSKKQKITEDDFLGFGSEKEPQLALPPSKGGHAEEQPDVNFLD